MIKLMFNSTVRKEDENFMDEIKFSSLGLSEEVLKAINDMGFEEPSQIQTQAIPVILQGTDIIGQAQTGTGKTLAFGAPIISKMAKSFGKIQVLILTPTRELAIQINDELVRISKFSRITSLPVYGGQPIERQLRALKKGVDIVVGTPGRILDHIRRKSVDFSDVKFFVLDEADEMLNMGFIDDIKDIMSILGEDKQTMLFSATMPEEIRKLATRYMKADAKQIAIKKNTMTVPLISQYYFEIKNKDRFEALCRILDVDQPESALIFCRTKKSVDEVVAAMQSRGYIVEGMHGDMGQNQRLNTLKKFREKNLDFLVATDVAARGIDVENITHVINYELPEDTESYVHRIGRTGRANREGTAYSLVTAREYMVLKQIEKTTKSKIKRKEVPTIDDIYEVKYKSILDRVKETIESNQFSNFTALASELDEEYNLVDVAAALMKMMFDKELGYDYSESSLDMQENSVRLFLSAGRMDNMGPGNLLEFLTKNAGISKDEIGDIDIMEKFTFLNVSQNAANEILEKCNGKKINRRKINIEVAKGKR